MTIAATNLNPAAAGLPTEGELLKLAAELYGEQPSAPSNAAAGTDWARIASEVLRAESEAPSSAAYSPTLVSAKKAAEAPSVSSAHQAHLPRSRATVGAIPVERLREDFPILQEPLSSRSSS